MTRVNTSGMKKKKQTVEMNVDENENENENESYRWSICRSADS